MLSNSPAGISRRKFLGGCAACAAAGLAGCTPMAGALLAGQTPSLPGPPAQKAKIRLVFSHKPPEQPTWPNIGYDYESRKKEITRRLVEGCPGIEFSTVTVNDAAGAKGVLEKDEGFDGYIVGLVGIWTGAARAIAASDKPTLFLNDLYAGCGEWLIEFARAQREGRKVAGVSSSNFDDAIQAARSFECIKKLQNSSVILVGRDVDKGIEAAYGTKVVPVDLPGLEAAYKAADREEGRKWADLWIKRARRVIEPPRRTIEDSGTMYLGMCELMRKHNARGITVNCLGGFYGGHITAYPCLGFMQLNNDGYVGACEGDQRSTMTMLLMSYLVGLPGFISDPVIDTAKNQVIYAHCVAPTKPYGPAGKANAFDIRNHSEDRQGACNRSFLPMGEMTTTILFHHHRREVILHQAKTVENVEEDKACRTKLAGIPVGDIDKLTQFWDQWGWHRVTYYGDLKRAVQHVAGLLGFKVVQEA